MRSRSSPCRNGCFATSRMRACVSLIFSEGETPCDTAMRTVSWSFVAKFQIAGDRIRIGITVGDACNANRIIVLEQRLKPFDVVCLLRRRFIRRYLQ